MHDGLPLLHLPPCLTIYPSRFHAFSQDTAQYPAKAAPAAVTDGDVNARRIGGMVVLVLMLIFGIACTTIPDGNDGMVSMDDLAIDKADTAWMLTSASLVRKSSWLRD